MTSIWNSALHLGRSLGIGVWRLAERNVHLLRSDFFISYSRNDGALYATGLQVELENAGLKCRIDRQHFFPGQPLSEATRRNLRKCSALLIVLTPHALASAHVASEVDFYRALRRPVIPINIDGILATLTVEWQQRLAGYIWLNETGVAYPGAALISEVKRSVNFLRYRTRLYLVVSLAVTVLALAVLFYNIRVARPELTKLWTVENTLEQGELPPFATAALSADGIVAGGTYDGNIYLVRRGGKLDPPLGGIKGAILALQFTEDGRSLLGIGADDHDIVCWNTQTREVRWTVRNDQDVEFRALSGPSWDHTFYAIDRRCVLWRVSPEGIIKAKIKLGPNDERPQAVSVGPDGRSVLVCVGKPGLALVPDAGSPIRFLHVETLGSNPELSGACYVGADRIAFVAEEGSGAIVKDSDGNTTSVTDTRSIYVCNRRGQQSLQLEASPDIYSVLIPLPASRLFWTHSWNGRVSLWSERAGTELYGVNVHPMTWDKVNAVAYDPTHRRLCMLSRRSIEVWELRWRALFGISIPIAERWK